jgi:hypothetical protein
LLKEVTADDKASESEKRFMDVIAPFVTGTQPAHLMEPTDRPFDHPSVNAQAAAMFGISFRQDRSDATLPQGLTMGLGIVRSISLHTARTLARTATFATYGRDRID